MSWLGHVIHDEPKATEETMKRISVDVAVIGAGTAGLAAYRAAIAAGRRAVLIEAGPYGTTCARVGCMPSKLLIAAAEAAHGASGGRSSASASKARVAIDGKAVMARVKRERDRFVGFVLEGVDAIPEADRVRGHAHFVDDRTLDVDDHTRIEFGRAVIATGSSPAIPPVLRAAGDRLIVNDDVFDWDDLPRSVAVFGPGVIGLELGQALHRLGVDVTLFGRLGHVGPFSDPALQAYARRRSSASSSSKRMPMCAASNATATASACAIATATARPHGGRRLRDRRHRTHAERPRPCAREHVARTRRAWRPAVRPEHDAMRGQRHLHRRRCRRRPAAPARSRRRGSHRRRKRRALSGRARPRPGARRSPSSFPTRSSRSSERATAISRRERSSPARCRSRTRGEAA